MGAWEGKVNTEIATVNSSVSHGAPYLSFCNQTIAPFFRRDGSAHDALKAAGRTDRSGEQLGSSSLRDEEGDGFLVE